MSYLSHRMKSLVGNVTATFLQEIFSFKTKGAFFGRIQKRICDPRSYGFFATTKTKNPKKDYFIMTR